MKNLRLLYWIYTAVLCAPFLGVQIWSGDHVDFGANALFLILVLLFDFAAWWAERSPRWMFGISLVSILSVPLILGAADRIRMFMLLNLIICFCAPACLVLSGGVLLKHRSWYWRTLAVLWGVASLGAFIHLSTVVGRRFEIVSIFGLLAATGGLSAAGVRPTGLKAWLGLSVWLGLLAAPVVGSAKALSVQGMVNGDGIAALSCLVFGLAGWLLWKRNQNVAERWRYGFAALGISTSLMAVGLTFYLLTLLQDEPWIDWVRWGGSLLLVNYLLVSAPNLMRGLALSENTQVSSQ